MFDRQSRIWTVQAGDTLSKIAGIVYGDWRKYPIIFNANSELVKDEDLIFPNWRLFIPDPNATAKTRIDGVNSDQDFLVKVNDKDLKIISQIEIDAGFSMGARVGAFTVPIEVGVFKVGDPVEVYIANQLVLKGVLITPTIQTNKNSGNAITWQISTQANDILYSSFKQTAEQSGTWINASVETIVNSLLKDYDFKIIYEDRDLKNQKFKKIGIGDNENIFSFLVKIFNQKGYFLQGLPMGDLYASKANINGAPIGIFNESQNISVNFNYQNLAKEYRALNQKKDSKGFATATNNFVKRNIFVQVDKDTGFDGDLQSFVDWYQANEFSKAVEMVLDANDLLNRNDLLWRPNNLIEITNSNYGFDKKLFLINQVKYILTKELRTAQLVCVLPETKAGKMPSSLPFM